MPYIAPNVFFVLLGVSEIALAVRKRAGRGAADRDRGSFYVLWLVIGLAIYFGIRLSITCPAYDMKLNKVYYPAGVVLFLGGTALRWWSILHLGRFFTVNVAIASDHRVVDDGPYTYVRHPSYTGALLAFCGLGLLLGNWLGAAVLVLPVLISFIYRIRLEERALLTALGEPYAAYMRRTKRLVPFIL